MGLIICICFNMSQKLCELLIYYYIFAIAEALNHAIFSLVNKTRKGPVMGVSFVTPMQLLNAAS